MDHDEAVRLGLADGDEEARVGLLVDEHVLFAPGADRVAEDARGPMAGVEADVEEMAAIGRPDCAAAGVGDHVGKVVTTLQAADRERVELRAGVVVRPGEQLVVGRVEGAADAEIGVSRGERVAVEHDLFRPAAAGHAHVQRVLAAFDGAHRIGPRTVGRRHGRNRPP